MAKRQSKKDVAQAKAAKQKKIAIVGAVLFVAVAAIQVPRTMKMLNKQPIPPQVTAVTTTPTPTDTTSVTPPDPNSLAAPTLAGTPTAAAPTTTPTSSNDLVSAVPVSADTGQLQTFERFATKDPFASQAPTGASAAPAASGGSSSRTSSSSGSGSTPTSTTSSTPTGTTPASPPTPPAPAPTSAVISINGELMSVNVGSDFPTAGVVYSQTGAPLFHLVSLTAKTAKIAIAGGSYADGSKAIPLTVKTPLTLQNTANGTKYTLILEPQGTAVPAPASTSTGGTSTTSTSSTPTPVVPSGSGG